MDVIDLTNESDDEDLKFDVNLFSHRSTNPDIQHAGRPNFTTKTHNIGMNTPPSYPSASRSPVASKSKGKVKETDSRLFAADGPWAGPSNESNHGDRVSKDISGKTNSRKRQAAPHETKSLPKAPKVRKIVSPSTTKGGKSINWSETIIISSDDGSGDDEVVCTRIEFNKASRSAGRSQTKNPRSHRPRPTDSPAGPSSQTAAIFTYPQSSALEEESYDEADWENYHAGFALPLYKDDSNEVPTALPDSEIDALSQRLRHQHVGRHRQPSERGRPDIKVLYPVKTNQKHHPGWPHGRHPSYYSDQVKVHTLYGPGMGGEDDYTAGGLELVTSIRQASGPISRISQNGPSAVVASAALGGLPSPSLTDVRTCNTPGALLCWNQKQRNEIQTMDAHYREDESIRYVDETGNVASETMRVYYTVCDAKFDPLEPTSVVTCSSDGTLQSWQFDENGIAQSSLGSYSHDYGIDVRPHDLEFKPGTSILVVGCENGESYLHSSPDLHPQVLRLKGDLLFVELVWGPSASPVEDILFIGGRDELGHRGTVQYWKLRPEKAVPWGELKGNSGSSPCESLAINAIGSQIAVFTSGARDSRHTVEFYDTRCCAAKPTSAFNIPSFSNNIRRVIRSPSISAFNGPGDASFSSSNQRSPSPRTDADEVLQASFSPDGIFLACARDDNMTNVWDSRFLGDGRGQEPLFTLQHGPSKASMDLRDRNWGIAGMTWINHMGSSSPPLLVTGGDDGAIKLWDMRRSFDQKGQLLAELETNVGHFVIGDATNGEIPLLAGDCHANFYVYDYRGKSSWRDW